MNGLYPRNCPTISVPRHYFQGRRLEYYMYYNLLSSSYPSVKNYDITSIIILHSLLYLGRWVVCSLVV